MTEQMQADPSLEDLDDIYGEVDDEWARLVNEMEAKSATAVISIKGGPGSGFHGHPGRPGQVGGSSSTGSRAIETGTFTPEEEYQLSHASYQTIANFDGMHTNELPYEPQLYEEYYQSTLRSALLKDQVVTDLSLDPHKGIKYETTNELVRSWAESSNDNNTVSLEVQRAAADYFNAELSPFQQECVLNNKRQYAAAVKLVAAKDEIRDAVIASGGVLPHPGNLSHTDITTLAVQYQNALPDEMMMRYDLAEAKYFAVSMGRVPEQAILFAKQAENLRPAIDTYVQRVYKNTQDWFAKRGYKPDDTITVYRGIDLTKLGALPDLKPGHYKYVGNAIESWTLNPPSTGLFGTTRLAAKIKVKNIFSTPFTGPGCVSEYEVIVRSGDMDTFVVGTGIG